MTAKCKTCNGRGRWQEVERTTDEGQTEYMQWHECNGCKGTGVDQDPEAGDNYDIGGDSYAD